MGAPPPPGAAQEGEGVEFLEVDPPAVPPTVSPASTAAADLPPESAATLARARTRSSPHSFRHSQVAPLAIAGLGILAALAVVPVLRPSLAPVTERLATLGSLVFLLSAPGYWLGLRHRALAGATVLVVALYAATAWVGGADRLHDLFVVAIVASFGVFALAGFNLVFVLEDLIYAAHGLLPGRAPLWRAAPLAATLALSLGLPWWQGHGGPHLPALWIGAIAASVLLGGWWLLRLVNGIDRRHLVLRELHLLVAGVLAASLLADGVGYVVQAEGLVPSVVAYLSLLGTWVYVSYTTLQRTHLLLRGRDAAPWAAILLSATYAILAHGQALYLQESTVAVQDLFSYRMAYMIIGIWIGVGFYVVRGLWSTIQALARMRGQGAARIAEGAQAAERRVGQATMGLYRTLDRALPGIQAGPGPAKDGAAAGGGEGQGSQGWELDGDGLHRCKDEETS